ncbi:CvpA family protein [Rhizobium sp. TH2]|uniref:CvpA family protein n=1 Tax=Rhizobium sp. TH2 TaxID=2775403 RepID=UPI002157CD91|nr:CvpA family protein [Rhizobium sp. TH2]UVC10605.1 CvpA family protein [Rhizobium sp. TH2]
MPITAFDGIVLAIALFSAVLAMVRGFSREVLSVVSWFGSAYAAYKLYPYGLPYAKNFIADEKFAIIASAAAIFLIALIVISFITMRIADMIIDSRIGALDRTLGFIFGAARGILIVVVAVQFYNEWVPPEKHQAWIAGSKSKPFLDDLGEKLKNALPEDVAALLRKKIEEKMNDANGKDNTATPPADTSTDTAPADQPADTAPAEEQTTPQQ